MEIAHVPGPAAFQERILKIEQHMCVCERRGLCLAPACARGLPRLAVQRSSAGLLSCDIGIPAPHTPSGSSATGRLSVFWWKSQEGSRVATWVHSACTGQATRPVV